MTDRRPPDTALMATASPSGVLALEQLDVPLVVLVGGATGTGRTSLSQSTSGIPRSAAVSATTSIAAAFSSTR